MEINIIICVFLTTIYDWQQNYCFCLCFIFRSTRSQHWPVRVWKQWSLKTSVSSISIPELPTSGDSCEPIANNLGEKHKDRKFNAWDRDPLILPGGFKYCKSDPHIASRVVLISIPVIYMYWISLSAVTQSGRYLNQCQEGPLSYRVHFLICGIEFYHINNIEKNISSIKK